MAGDSEAMGCLSVQQEEKVGGACKRSAGTGPYTIRSTSYECEFASGVAPGPMSEMLRDCCDEPLPVGIALALADAVDRP
ncbi:hypothetical protein MBLL_02611 [Methylobacterium bullatum]|uniref:Uncharacterized protein n=1 Tax=Methylobacterium bullatum TaxID=570505 RepID=A0A679K0P0_9HYPH|nr:hypothetical protein MBLL_02611 [Methylobacterium bullatum]